MALPFVQDRSGKSPVSVYNTAGKSDFSADLADTDAGGVNATSPVFQIIPHYAPVQQAAPKPGIPMWGWGLIVVGGLWALNSK